MWGASMAVLGSESCQVSMVIQKWATQSGQRSNEGQTSEPADPNPAGASEN